MKYDTTQLIRANLSYYSNNIGEKFHINYL